MKTKSFILQNLHHFIDKAEVDAIGYSYEDYGFEHEELQFVSDKFFQFMENISITTIENDNTSNFYNQIIKKLNELLTKLWQDEYLLAEDFKSDIGVMESEASGWLKSQRV
jgi:phosphoribosylaminoimidazole-succinocarboxamide synthase